MILHLAVIFHKKVLHFNTMCVNIIMSINPSERSGALMKWYSLERDLDDLIFGEDDSWEPSEK